MVVAEWVFEVDLDHILFICDGIPLTFVELVASFDGRCVYDDLLLVTWRLFAHITRGIVIPIFCTGSDVRGSLEVRYLSHGLVNL